MTTAFVTIKWPVDPGVLVTEHLRYAGAVSVGPWAGGYVPAEAIWRLGEPDPGDTYITVRCPWESVPERWGRRVVHRLASFGVEACWWIEEEAGDAAVRG